jgi:hypothetical protein
MLAPIVLVTPMILAAEPVRLEMLDQTYDHRTQTSTFTGNPDKRLRLAYSSTTTYPEGAQNGWRSKDSDSD